jgi:hypothetical protein
VFLDFIQPASVAFDRPKAAFVRTLLRNARGTFAFRLPPAPSVLPSPFPENVFQINGFNGFPSISECRHRQMRRGCSLVCSLTPISGQLNLIRSNLHLMSAFGITSGLLVIHRNPNRRRVGSLRSVRWPTYLRGSGIYTYRRNKIGQENQEQHMTASTSPLRNRGEFDRSTA